MKASRLKLSVKVMPFSLECIISPRFSCRRWWLCLVQIPVVRLCWDATLDITWKF